MFKLLLEDDWYKVWRKEYEEDEYVIVLFEYHHKDDQKLARNKYSGVWYYPMTNEYKEMDFDFKESLPEDVREFCGIIV